MKKTVRRHWSTENEEQWELKLKDKPDQSAFKIDFEGRAFSKMEVIKVNKQNNRFIIRLIV